MYQPSPPPQQQQQYGGGGFEMPVGPARMKLIFLAVEWFLALLTFSIMSSIGGYGNISSFSFLVATGVLLWLYIMIFAFPAVWSVDHRPLPIYSTIPPRAIVGIMLGADCIFLLFTFASATASAVKAHQALRSGGPSLYAVESTDIQNNLNASILFDYCLFFMLIAHTFFDFRSFQAIGGQQPAMQQSFDPGYAQSNYNPPPQPAGGQYEDRSASKVNDDYQQL